MAEDGGAGDGGGLPVTAIDGDGLIIAEEGVFVVAELRGKLPTAGKSLGVEVIEVSPDARFVEFDVEAASAYG
jgi:hypothetical protein